MVYKFTKNRKKVLAIANELATDLGHSYIGTEHILYGLACEENGVASKKARQLVYYPVPMSLIRWSNYLNPQQIKDFLLPENKIKESVDVNEVDEFEYDLGI